MFVRDEVTVIAAVPTMYAALLHHPSRTADQGSRLRIAVSGGAALPVEILHGFEEAFGCPLLEGYGLSETSPVASFNRPEGPRRPGTIGVPIDGRPAPARPARRASSSSPCTAASATTSSSAAASPGNRTSTSTRTPTTW